MKDDQNLLVGEKNLSRQRIADLLDEYPDLLARKDLDRVSKETNLPVSRAILYDPPKGLKVETIRSRKLLWKDDLIRYLVGQMEKPL